MRRSVVFAVLAGCSHVHGVGGGGDVAVDGPAGDPCTGDVTRCEGSTFQKCIDGTFLTSENCAAACAPAIGCVECDPVVGNTCDSTNDVISCNANGTYGPVIQSCGEGRTCTAGTCSKTCTADGVDLVYVVDEANHFMSFDPRLLPGDPFTLIGTLACPTVGQSIQQPAPGDLTPMPFSMSVDRDGVAWVLYTSGELFQVSIVDGSCTAAANTVGATGMTLFGMGFVTDAANSTSENMYMAGGNDNPASSPRKLAYDDTHGGDLTPMMMGNIAATSDYSPELTGTNEAKLYGFFPNITNIAFVQEIDKTNGAAVGTAWNLGTTGLGGNLNDWAFAQWGGVFYVFVTTSDGMGNRNSTVRSIDRATNAYNVVLQNLTYFIDGAGVSTCAPTMIE